jgi:hypothetical protein
VRTTDNRRTTEVTGKDGGPVATASTFVLDSLSDEELEAWHRELSRPSAANE